MEKESGYDFEDEFARQNAVVEYYYGVTIDLHYPLLKKYSQLENLRYCFWLSARNITGTTDKDFEEI